MDSSNEKCLYLYLATEDLLSEAVALRLLQESGVQFYVVSSMGKKGNAYLRKNIEKFARLARNVPVLLMTDLDSGSCPAALRAGWLRRVPMPEGMLFRVAVREVEAWVLADRERFAEFSGAEVSEVPPAPEDLLDPKLELLNLIRRRAPRQLREEMTSSQGRGAGAGYNPRLIEFVRTVWSPAQAAKKAPSLERARQRIKGLAKKFAR